VKLQIAAEGSLKPEVGLMLMPTGDTIDEGEECGQSKGCFAVMMMMQRMMMMCKKIAGLSVTSGFPLLVELDLPSRFPFLVEMDS